MKKSFFGYLQLIIVLTVAGCNGPTSSEPEVISDSLQKGSFGYDVEFLKKYNKNLVMLKTAAGNSRVLVSGDYQGRVMTSTATGDSGLSYGWINYNLVASGKKNRQFNPVGGEERFWLGPEGGQYALYFKGGDSFNIHHWQVPALIDTDSFQIKESSDSTVTFSREATLTNYSGTAFKMGIARKISLLEKTALEEKLQVSVPSDLSFVAYQSINTVTNAGSEDWSKAKGLPSIWLLGMFTPSDQTAVIIPFRYIKKARSFITDNYFGAVPDDRLQLKDSVLFFTCDGKYRSKIGLSPSIAKPIAASFDFSKNILTLILFPVQKDGDYVNSKWEHQKEPYKGDVVNAYNDGPLADGSQLGPFYELESSSAALALKKGQSEQYSQITCHFQGPFSKLSAIAKELLGIELDKISR